MTRVEALDAGADDYITIPFQIRELAARVRSGIRRFRAPEALIEESLQVGEISLDPGRRIVKKADTRVHLTPMEFSALRLLMENAGKPLTYVRLLSSLWGPEFAEHPEKLRVLMNELRKKIETDTANPRYLLTEVRVGYRFAGN